MQDGSEKVELCIAAADELILHPGVDVEEVAGVLPRNISSQKIILIKEFEIFQRPAWRSAPCWRGEVGSSSQPAGTVCQVGGRSSERGGEPRTVWADPAVGRPAVRK